jgi:broad specificity phosphatase PhoE
MNITHYLILTIIRHGQTQGNVNNIVEGITDTPLNDNGMHQAKSAGEWLKNEKFDFVITSDLKRCKETAYIILETNLNFTKKEGNYAEMELLREKNFGIHEGTRLEDYQSISKKAGFSWFDFVPKGAESLDDVKERAKEFLSLVYGTISSSNKQKLNMLVVTHGFVIAQLISCIYEETKCSGLPKDELENPWRQTNPSKILASMPNTAITRFEIVVDEKSFKPTSCKNTLFKSTDHFV